TDTLPPVSTMSPERPDLGSPASKIGNCSRCACDGCSIGMSNPNLSTQGSAPCPNYLTSLALLQCLPFQQQRTPTIVRWAMAAAAQQALDPKGKTDLVLGN